MLVSIDQGDVVEHEHLAFVGSPRRALETPKREPLDVAHVQAPRG